MNSTVFQTMTVDGKNAQRFLKMSVRLSEKLGLNVPPIVNLLHLRGLPVGTFGRLWADTLDHHQLQPLTEGPRRQQLHDGIHVLTGYGVDPMGEAEVQAFLLGTQFRLVHLVLGLALLRVAIRQAQLPPSVLTHPSIRTRLRKAYYRGRGSHFNPDTWQPEILWEKPTEQVRTGFGL